MAMCGRFILIPQDELNRIIQDVVRNVEAQLHSNVSAEYHDVYPKADVPIIIPRENKLDTAVMQWGCTVSWSKKPVFNTRADTAFGKKDNMWWNSLENRRCIVPSRGFYEPHKSEKTTSKKTGREITQQYVFQLPDSTGIVFMAGIYDNSQFSIMTTDPNTWMETIHDRMPIVLHQSEIDTWLNGDYHSLVNRSKIELVSRKEAA